MAALDNIQYIDSASINVLTATGSFNGPHTGSFSGPHTGSFSGSFSGSLSGIITGSLFGTSSWATNTRTGSNGAFAWASIWYNGAALTSTTYNCAITRSAIGTFAVSFVNSAANNQYAVVTNGITGSGGLPTVTASMISPVFLRTNGFTMSVQKTTASALVPADFTSASFAVFSFF